MNQLCADKKRTPGKFKHAIMVADLDNTIWEEMRNILRENDKCADNDNIRNRS